MANRTAMIDVGGGFRAIYGAGVMDRMLEDGMHVDHCYGVSAGSANMVSYISGQHGRNHTFYTQYAFRKEYASFDSYVKNHNYANLDYVYSTLSNHDGENPVDYEAFAANPTEFTVVACNADDGSTKYFDKSDVGYDNYDIMKASSAVPVAPASAVFTSLPWFDVSVPGAAHEAGSTPPVNAIAAPTLSVRRRSVLLSRYVTKDSLVQKRSPPMGAAPRLDTLKRFRNFSAKHKSKCGPSG